MKVSVIIDTYNYGHFIEEAIESALNQDFPKEQMEIIVVDDGSTDNTKEQVKKYEDKIKYIYQENKGQASAFNTGFAQAQGEIICLLDADDIWYFDKLAKVLKCFKSNENLGLVRHWLHDIDSTGEHLSNTVTQPQITGTENLGQTLQNRIYFIGSSGLSFRKKFLEKILPVPEELTICPDEYLSSHILFYSKTDTIPEYLGSRRIHRSNVGLYTQNLLNPINLEFYIKIRRLLDKFLHERIEQLNITFDRNIFFPSEINICRAEIILNSLRGKKWTALKILYRQIKKHPLTLYLGFRYFFLLSAIVSPWLYGKMYQFYSKNKSLIKLRKTLLLNKNFEDNL